MLAVKRVLRYVKGTLNYGLLYSKQGNSKCVGYSDADWAGDFTDRKSTSGYCFQLCGAAISWNSSKQSCVALSTAEAEYVALSSAAQEAAWLVYLLSDLTKCTDSEPLVVYEDNVASICIANDSQSTRKTKHIEIKYHFVRYQISKNNLCLKHCSTDEMIADIFTKGLSPDKFKKFRKMLGVSC